MSVRLTKALREEIAETVYKASDLPARLAELEKLAATTAASFIKASWPEGFEEALKTYPREWFQSVTSVHVSSSMKREGTEKYIELSSVSIGKIYTYNIKLDDPIPYPAHAGIEKSYVVAIHEWLYDHYRPLYQTWANDKQKLMDSAYALLSSYRTVDALLKAAPEMKQFIPTTGVSYPPPALPVSNVITTFLERGITFRSTD